METVNHRKELEAVTDKIQLFESEPRFARHMAFVLISELLWGKQRLAGESLPVRTVLQYKKRLKKCAVAESGQVGLDYRELEASWPRYARVNTLTISLEAVLQQLEGEGWRQVQHPAATTSTAAFLQLLAGLQPDQFMSDLHVPGLLVFPAKSELHLHPLVTAGSLLLQDKASCFPVLALAPPPGATVLDACAAPGMKTTQLAGAVGAAGRVTAVERSTQRYHTLCRLLERNGATAVSTVINQDFLEVDPAQHPAVQYIAVDPSCSGTGMVRRGGGEEEPGEERLASLAAVQTRLLSHALAFPAAKRVVYSTCATSLQENEQVVSRVLSLVPGWKVVKNILPTWERRGLGENPMANHFVRAVALEDRCNGFFVAVLKRKKKKKIL